MPAELTEVCKIGILMKKYVTNWTYYAVSMETNVVIKPHSDLSGN